jgi:hypothetical protein
MSLFLFWFLEKGSHILLPQPLGSQDARRAHHTQLESMSLHHLVCIVLVFSHNKGMMFFLLA